MKRIGGCNAYAQRKYTGTHRYSQGTGWWIAIRTTGFDSLQSKCNGLKGRFLKHYDRFLTIEGWMYVFESSA